MGIHDSYIDEEIGRGGEATCIRLGTMLGSVTLAANRTFEMDIEVDIEQAKAGAIEIIAGVSGGNSPAVAVSIQALAAWDADDTFSSATAAIWDNGQSSSATIPIAASSIRTSLARTDFVLPPPVARTDGRPYALYRIRGYATVGTSIFAGQNDKDYAAWASRTGPRMRMRYNTTDGDQRTSSSNWAASTHCPFVGLVVKSATPVINVASFGDSQDMGAATVNGAGPAFLACETLNAQYAGEVVFSHASRAFSGQTYTQILNNVRDYFIQGYRPDVVALPIGSQNSVTASFPQSAADTMHQQLWGALALIRSYGAKVVLRAMPPAPYASFQWGSSGDAVRLAHNAAEKANAAAAGIEFVDVPASFIGPVDGNGQQTAVTGQADPVHFGDDQLAIWQADFATAIDRSWSSGRGNELQRFEFGTLPATHGTASQGRSNQGARADHKHPVRFAPGSSNAPTANGEVTFELTNNTTLTFKARGSDGTTRSGTVTLA